MGNSFFLQVSDVETMEFLSDVIPNGGTDPFFAFCRRWLRINPGTSVFILIPVSDIDGK